MDSPILNPSTGACAATGLTGVGQILSSMAPSLIEPNPIGAHVPNHANRQPVKWKALLWEIKWNNLPNDSQPLNLPKTTAASQSKVCLCFWRHTIRHLLFILAKKEEIKSSSGKGPQEDLSRFVFPVRVNKAALARQTHSCLLFGLAALPQTWLSWPSMQHSPSDEISSLRLCKTIPWSLTIRSKQSIVKLMLPAMHLAAVISSTSC